ncbi:YhhY [Pantoea ananatis LMG 20103]|uniref:YhhY n=1 Tax=Pantoea ananatis (strain LMG 20103) TaxID=706191 RepID=D4GDD5_PANAM|nr:YhhY [Pantoea ananatis LMG 20103]
MDITLRGREPGDAAAYQRLYGHPAVYPWTLQLPFPSVATWEKKFAKMDAEGFINFIAEVEGKWWANSRCLPIIIRVPATASVSVLASIPPSLVGESESILIRNAMDYARNWLGITRMELEVFHDNHRALALYERLGFEREGIRRQASLREGKFHDVVMMAKLLTETA